MEGLNLAPGTRREKMELKNLIDQKLRLSMETLLRGSLCTVNILVLTNLDQLFLVFQTLLTLFLQNKVFQ
jgi:hypothetical protein